MRYRKLHLERLEERCTPVTWGTPWPDASHLTLSFAPDGTAIGSYASDLFESQNALGPTALWQREAARAFQTWAVNANINFCVTPDTGLPFGTTGAIQGDARFGDIRLGAYRMPFDAEATASAFQLEAGTWSGDVAINSAAGFGLNSANAHDLFSVLLHEAGHVFGLDHSDDPASPLYPSYLGVRSGLSAADIAALQALYGGRTPDRFEGATGNGAFATATQLSLLANADGSLALGADADITTLQDRDVYSFPTLLNVGGAVIQVRTAGISLMTPRVSVFDSSGTLLVSAASVDPLAGGLTIRVNNIRPLSTYYVKIESAQQDVFGIGAYQLTVHYLPLVNLLAGTATSVVTHGLSAVATFLINNDLHTNDSFATALNLQQTLSGPDARFDHAFRGSISDSWDVDVYKFQAPAAPAEGQLVLSAMIWALQDGGLDPSLRIYDADRNPVAAQVLINDGYTFTIQIEGAVAGAVYYAKVDAAGADADHRTGSYFLGLDFHTNPARTQNFTSAALGDAQRTVTQTLTLTANRLFHFILSADAHGAPAGATVVMSIIDQTGKVVYSLTGNTDEPVTGNAYLLQGCYVVRFTATAANGELLPDLECQLDGSVLDDPIGPEPVDPTADPSGAPSDEPPPPPDTWSGSGSSGVPPEEPASDPYTSSIADSDGTSTPSGSDSASDGTTNPTSDNTSRTDDSTPPTGTSSSETTASEPATTTSDDSSSTTSTATSSAESEDGAAAPPEEESTSDPTGDASTSEAPPASDDQTVATSTEPAA